MRTKALVCAAALAVGIASTMAQSVYSLNVVGYYNVTIPGNSLQMIANQFNTTNNTIGSLLPSVPPDSQFFKFVTGSGYSVYTFDPFDLAWQPDGSATLNPGEGGFLKNADVGPLTVTFVGEVPQGGLTNPYPAGLSIRSSMVPQAGGVDTLGLTAEGDDQIFRWTGGSYQVYTFDSFDLVWQPSVPTLNVGESVFLSKVSAGNWVRNFTVQ